MESADMVLRPTLFEKAAAAGIRSALLSAKKKTVSLLPRGAEVVMAAETPTSEWVERLGQLVVLGDRKTVFGGLDAEMESLPAEYRSHGGPSEAKVPYIYNAERAPDSGFFRANVDLARWVFRT